MNEETNDVEQNNPLALQDICTSCGSKETETELTPHFVHYAKLTCKNCKRWIRWIKNPESETRNKLIIEKAKKKHEKKGTLRCSFCDRTQEQLGKNECLTVDHIIELRDGGEDKVENTRILCLACHKLRLWVKVYMNLHFKK